MEANKMSSASFINGVDLPKIQHDIKNQDTGLLNAVMNGVQTEETIQHNIDSVSQLPILNIDFGQEDLLKLQLNSHFLAFLEEKGRVKSTTDILHEFKVHGLTPRAGFADEYGNTPDPGSATREVSGTNSPLTDPATAYYKLATVVSPKIKISDMFRLSEQGNNINTEIIAEYTQDINTAIDEALFNASNTNPTTQNKFDGLRDVIPQTNVIDLEGADFTPEAVQDAIQKVTDFGGIADYVTGTGNAIAQVISNDDDNKIFNAGKETTVGRWSRQFLGSTGDIPMITNPNINNRAMNGSPSADEIYVGVSQSHEVRFLSRAFVKNLSESDLSETKQIASFVVNRVKIPQWHVLIKSTSP
jgi:hypothetical protein